MVGLAALICALGIIILSYGAFTKRKTEQFAAAPLVRTGDVATESAAVEGCHGAVSVEGQLKCDHALISPVTETPCLHYELRVVGSWQEASEAESEELVVEDRTSTFMVDDGSGPVAVQADRAEFDPLERTFEETKRGEGALGATGASPKGEPINFGAYAFTSPSASRANQFICTERVFKAHPRLYVLGRLDAGTFNAPAVAALVVSNKRRQDVLGAATKPAQRWLTGGAALAVVGLVFGLVAIVDRRPGVQEPSRERVASSLTAGAPATASASPPSMESVPPAASAAAREVPASRKAERSGAICVTAVKCCKALTKKGASAAKCDKLAFSVEPACKKALAGFKKQVKAKRRKQVLECE